MTWPLETVVCGVEDSAESRAAACAARGLAGAMGARLVLAHIAPRAQDAASGHVLLDELADGARGVEVERLVIPIGEPARRLSLEAERMGAGLLVVGRRAGGADRDALLGSVSGRLAADSPCPVVIVPPGGAGLAPTVAWEHGPVVCGFDGSDNAGRAAAVAAVLAARLSGALRLVQVVDSVVEAPAGAMPTDDVLEDTASRALWRDGHRAVARSVDVTRTVRHGDVAAQLERVASAATAPLIVIGSRGREPWRASMLGSVARQVLERARRAVVVVPPATSPVRAP